MGFHPFDVTAPHIAYTCLGGFVVFFGMFSLFIRERLYIGEACLAFIFGVVIGPNGGAIFNPRHWAPSESAIIDSEVLNTITLEVTRVVLAIGVFAIGVELPNKYMKKHWRSLFFLLFPVMTWGWFVCAGLIFALIPALDFLSSLAVAACLTPTDPILAAAVVGGKYADKHVPAHLRHLLAAESGCNDGAAFPFLFIAIYLILEKSHAHAVQDWFLITFLYEVLLGVTFGACLGFSFRYVMRFCESKDLIDRKSYVAQYVSLALLSVGSTTLLGSDDLLSAFASGTAFAWDGFFNKQTEDSAFSSVIDLLFNTAAFIYIGAWMPFDLFSSVELTLTPWRLVVLAILVLLFRRLPIVMALYRFIPDIKTIREALFSGHFGPIGVGAVFISTLAVERLPRPHDPPRDQVEVLAASIQPIVAFMVLCSITIHGLSIPFFSLSRRVHSVSRTWSRHQSTDLAGPEWATQTRKVVRAEDVVINRDVGDETEIMERGESDKIDSDMTVLEPSVEPEKDQGTPGQEETPRDENPPRPSRRAGDNAEWREGPHLIIEHEQGPGNEVEVEVVRNAFMGGDEDKVSTAFHGTEASVRKEVGKYIQKLTYMPKHVEQEIARDLHAMKDEAKQLKVKAEKGMRHAGDVMLASRGEHVQKHEEPDEDWQDEDLDSKGAGPGPSSSAAHSASAEKMRSKSPRHKFVRPAVFHSRVPTRKRPESVRRGVSAARPKAPASSPAPAAQTAPASGDSTCEEDERGRNICPKGLPRVSLGPSVRPPDSTLGTHTPHDSVLRLRLEPARAESPARSIRFADEPGATAPETPSHGTYATRPGTPVIADDITNSSSAENSFPRGASDVPGTTSRDKMTRTT